jgi:hypothetical protein
MTLPQRYKNQPLGDLLGKGTTATTSTSSNSGSEHRADEYSTTNDTSQETSISVMSMHAGKRYFRPSLGLEIVRFMSGDTPTYPREMVFMSE